MNVTEDGIKHRKLQTEGCLQKVPAEQEGYAEACAPSKITENNVTNAHSSADRLLEKILDKDNMMLNELDRELERRGHRFVRYADDLTILCKSKRSAYRTLEKIVPYIEGKLFLKVNRQKTTVDYIGKVKFLGFTFYRHKEVTRVRIHPKTVAKMKNKIKELTARSNGWGNEYRAMKLKQFIIGWVNYFKLADMKRLLKEIDEWIRRRIRMVYWKQWKKIKTRFRMLKHFGIDESKAWEYANTRKGYWKISNSPILNRSLDNQKIGNLGYISFFDYYQRVCVN